MNDKKQWEIIKEMYKRGDITQQQYKKAIEDADSRDRKLKEDFRKAMGLEEI